MSRSPRDGLRELTGEQLRAVVALWARGEREIATSFGGTSMRPTLAPGDEVLLACGEAPRIGAIGCCVRGDDVVVHRLVALAEAGTWALTRGDASLLPDPPGAFADFVACIGKVRRDGRWVDPAAAPDSLARRTALILCVGALRASPAAGRLFILALWALRRPFVGGLRMLARRRVPESPDDPSPDRATEAGS